MVCGQPPFLSEGFGELAHMHIAQAPLSPRSHAPELSRQLEQGILRFRALIAHGNRAATALVRGLGEVLVQRYEDGAIELVVRLA